MEVQEIQDRMEAQEVRVSKETVDPLDHRAIRDN